MGTKIGMVQIFFKIQKFWQNRRWANGIRVEYHPRIQYVAAQWRSQKFTVQSRRNSRKCHRKNSIYVDVQRHILWKQKTMKKNVWHVPNSYFCVREGLDKDSGRLLVLVLRKVVLCQCHKDLEQNCRKDVVGILAESVCPIFRAAAPLSQRSTQKQRTWKTVDTQRSRPGNGWDDFSHYCLCNQAQFLRSIRREMWRVCTPSRENGATRCDGTIKFHIRGRCDQDRSSF